MMRRLYIAMLALPALASCAGTFDYTRPTALYTVDNTAVIQQPREAVWKAAIPKLGRQFFVINNLDQSSGLVNLSYSGDPEQYVDCGQLSSYVKNARGERTYSFPGARANQQYEIMNPSGLFFLNRQMKLDGRINLIFEEIDKSSTRVTANTRYVLDREVQVQNTEGRTGQIRHSISFNTGSGASFPASPGQPQDRDSLECKSTGKLEQDLIRLLQ